MTETMKKVAKRLKDHGLTVTVIDEFNLVAENEQMLGAFTVDKELYFHVKSNFKACSEGCFIGRFFSLETGKQLLKEYEKSEENGAVGMFFETKDMGRCGYSNAAWYNISFLIADAKDTFK